jgi:hypothetical protein
MKSPNPHSDVLDNQQQSLTYVRFLNFIDAIRGNGGLPQLDHLEASLIDALAKRWASHRPITVLETINSGVSGASQSTIHRRLKTLQQLDMITLRLDDHDKRVKYLEPTPKCIDYLNHMGACLVMTAETLQPST